MENKSFPKLNKELCSLIGLLLSDGSIYYDKSKRTYCIQFTNKLPSMRDYFKDLMKNIFGANRFYENNCKNAVSIRVFSKSIAEFLFSFSPTYRTLKYSENRYPNCKVPEEIKSSKTFAAEFLKSFASCDGSVYSNPKNSLRVVELSSSHPQLIKDLSDCLDLLYIEHRICKKSLRISNKPNIKKFAGLVGFLESSRISDTTSEKFGKSKNALLKGLF